MFTSSNCSGFFKGGKIFPNCTISRRTADVLSQLAKLAAEVSAEEKRLAGLVSAAGDCRVVSKEEKDRVAVRREGAVNEWRKRKRMCDAVVDAIMESYPKSKMILVDDMGIEMDDVAGVKLPKD